MMRYLRWIIISLVLAFAGGIVTSPNPALATTAAEINRDAKSALEKLYAKSPKAKALGEKAKGVLVFTGIAKAGFMVGGQYGEGALLKDGKAGGVLQHRPGLFRSAGRDTEIRVCLVFDDRFGDEMDRQE